MLPSSAFYRPLCPENRDQGDPYVIAAPPEARTRYRYYTYVTGENAATGRAFPAYGSDDLLTWQPLGETLEADTGRAHWAPCVRHVPGLPRPFVMLYSRGQGLGEAAHIGHQIRRAHATSPEGPFVDSGHVLTPRLDFAIDPDVYRRADGTLCLAFATDYVLDAPLGTGLAEATIADDLTALTSQPQALARARYRWQVYDAARKLPWMTIPGVNWQTDTVVWHTLEGPVGGLVSPSGQDVYLYSGGCFFDYYAVGALLRNPDGQIVDVTNESEHFLLQPDPARGFYGPGHCSWLRDHDGDEYLMFHARYRAPDAPRQMSLAPLRWGPDGFPSCPPYTPAGQ